MTTTLPSRAAIDAAEPLDFPDRNEPTAAVLMPRLQWSNGKSIARPAGSTDRFLAYIGFHIQTGDEALDAALDAAEVPQVEIRHQRTGAAPEIKVHWHLGEYIQFFPITAGPPATSIAGCLKRAEATAGAGIGLKWPPDERSQMAVQGFVGALVEVGYMEPVIFAVRSKMTDVLLFSLLDHLRVCKVADGLITQKRTVRFWELALPLGPDEEQEWGKGDTASVVPFRANHPDMVDADYIKSIWRSAAINAAAAEALPAVRQWAAEYRRTQGVERRTEGNHE